MAFRCLGMKRKVKLLFFARKILYKAPRIRILYWRLTCFQNAFNTSKAILTRAHFNRNRIKQNPALNLDKLWRKSLKCCSKYEKFSDLAQTAKKCSECWNCGIVLQKMFIAIGKGLTMSLNYVGKLVCSYLNFISMNFLLAYWTNCLVPGIAPWSREALWARDYAIIIGKEGEGLENQRGA